MDKRDEAVGSSDIEDEEKSEAAKQAAADHEVICL